LGVYIYSEYILISILSDSGTLGSGTVTKGLLCRGKQVFPDDPGVGDLGGRSQSTANGNLVWRVRGGLGWWPLVMEVCKVAVTMEPGRTTSDSENLPSPCSVFPLYLLFKLVTDYFS
jgi:hypothetical protein